MTKDVKPLWIDIKHIDESWHSNPGVKYGKFFRLIAERIPTELEQAPDQGDLYQRIHTVEDVIDWLIDQAVKGENDIRYNYDWQNTDPH
jgi:hypothetical protein